MEQDPTGLTFQDPTDLTTQDMDAVYPPLDPIHLGGVQAFFMIIYTIIFVLGIFGNALTCYVVCRNRAMQTVTNFFITNLALSDMLLCVLCVPFTPLYHFLGHWVFGKFMCYVVASAQSISVYTSTVTLTSIAVDRFFVIIYPFRPRMKISTCFVIVFGSWLYSILVTLPYTTRIHYKDLDNRTYCEEVWGSDNLTESGYGSESSNLTNSINYRKVYGGVAMTTQFILPFIIIAFCYIKVSLKLNEQARAKPGKKDSRKEEMDRERKRRTNRMLIAMVLIFGMSWLPLNCANITNDLSNESVKWKYFNLCFFFAHTLAMSSTCYNPFLYAWLNENFRKEFAQVLPGFDTSNRRSSADRVGWRSDRTCNGNETEATLFQSTSMIRRCSSVRTQLAEATTKDSDKRAELVDIENLYVSKATYSLEKEKVELHLSTDNSVLLPALADDSSSPPKDTKTKSEQNATIGSVHGQLV